MGADRFLGPALAKLRGRPAGAIRTDLLAGLTVAAVAVPASLGMAELAGVPPVVGLYASSLPLMAYALFGSSRHLVVGPDGALSALTATTIAPLAVGDSDRYLALSAMLALLVGAVMIAAGLLRLGFMADFLSKPVLLGYLNGVSLNIIVSQLGKVLGLSVNASGFFHVLWELVHHLVDTSVVTLVLSLVLLASALLLRHYAPRFPGILLLVAVADIASVSLHLKEHGVAVIGPITGGAPHIGLPSVSLHDMALLLVPAAGMALMSFGDATAVARSTAARNGYEINANRELAGLGAANAVSGLIHGIPTSSSGSRTAASEQAGGRSQLVGVCAGAVVLLVAWFATSLIEPLPKAVLGVVVIAAAIGMLDVKGVLRLRKVQESEAALAVLTMVAVLVLGLLNGLLVAVALSIGVFVYRSVRPHDAVLGQVHDIDGYHDINRYQRAQTVPGLVVYRFDGPLFFANTPFFIERVRDIVAEAPPDARWLLLNAEAIVQVDTTAVDALRALHAELGARGITMAVARAKGPLRKALEATGLIEQIGRENIFPTVSTGVSAYLERNPDAAADPRDGAD